jgi:hypothetical protein
MVFMHYGRWENFEQNANVVNGNLIYIDMSIFPMQHDGKQNFAMIDTLTNMLSRQYIMLTSPEGQLDRLIPQKQPDEMGVFIPPNYKGKVLRLWRFKLKPNYDDVIKNRS